MTIKTDISQGQSNEHVMHDHKHVKKERSFGNRVFDLIVWPTFQWVGVWGTSLTLGWMAQKGNGRLNGAFAKMSTWLETHLKEPMGTQLGKKVLRSTPKEWAEGIALFTALSVGGTIMTPIVKWFEHRREKISRKIDVLFNKTPKDPAEIKPEPKQTWFSVVMGRAASVVVAYTAFMAVGPKNSKAVTDWVGGKIMKAIGAIRLHSNNKEISEFVGVAVFDLLFTSITASVNYSWSRFVAFKEHHIEKPYPEKTESKTSVAPVDSTDVNATSWADNAIVKKQRAEKAESFSKAVTSSRISSEQVASL